MRHFANLVLLAMTASAHVLPAQSQQQDETARQALRAAVPTDGFDIIEDVAHEIRAANVRYDNKVSVPNYQARKAGSQKAASKQRIQATRADEALTEAHVRSRIAGMLGLPSAELGIVMEPVADVRLAKGRHVTIHHTKATGISETGKGWLSRLIQTLEHAVEISSTELFLEPRKPCHRKAKDITSAIPVDEIEAELDSRPIQAPGFLGLSAEELVTILNWAIYIILAVLVVQSGLLVRDLMQWSRRQSHARRPSWAMDEKALLESIAEEEEDEHLP